MEESLTALSENEGVIACAFAQVSQGKLIAGKGKLEQIERSLTYALDIYESQGNILSALGSDPHTEDVMISFNRQYHLIRPIPSDRDVVVYLVLNKSRSNLARVRGALSNVARQTSPKAP